MESNTEEILKIIDESFLKSEEKQILKDQLEKEGYTESFLANFDNLLIAELEKRSAVYGKVIEDFESRHNELEAVYQKNRQERDAELENKLVGVNPTDLDAKEKIFDQYYQEIDSAQINHEGKLKALYSELFASVMQDIL